jgi:peptidoglycan/LPS O-acetylase OafA/YrhL
VIVRVIGGRKLVLPTALWLMVSSVVTRTLGLYPRIAIARSDGLALGAVLAAGLSDTDSSFRRSRWLNAGFVAVCACALLYLSAQGSKIGDLTTAISPSVYDSLAIFAVNAFYFGAVGLVVCHNGHPSLEFLRNRALRYLGQISYGVYLYSLVVIHLAEKFLGPRTFAAGMIVAILVLLSAAVSAELLERPVGDLKNRFQYTAPQKRTGW